MDHFDIPKIPTVFNIRSHHMVQFLQERARQQDYEKLYQHQIEAVLTVDKYFQERPGEPAIVVLPTGCGKTGVAVLTAYAVGVGKVLVITPSGDVSQQIIEAFVGSEEKQKPCFLIDREISKSRNVIPGHAKIRKRDEIVNYLENDLLVVNAHKLDIEILGKIPSDNYDLVIVDEAHHYPAKTWKVPIDYFNESKRLFLTSTPFHQGKRVLPEFIRYELKNENAIERQIIRSLTFDEIQTGWTEQEVFEELSREISRQLDAHDIVDRTVRHQAMVLTRLQTEAQQFSDTYNRVANGIQSAVYISGTKPSISDSFKRQELRVLVVSGRLTEGFDHKPVSVVAIARKVGSPVLFAQFVGRAVRRAHLNEMIDAVLISHPYYNQRPMYDQFYNNEIATVELKEKHDED